MGDSQRRPPSNHTLFWRASQRLAPKDAMFTGTLFCLRQVETGEGLWLNVCKAFVVTEMNFSSAKGRLPIVKELKMCGRYTLTADADSIQLAFNLASVDGYDRPRYNIAPSQQVAVISDRDPDSLSFMKWGLVPSWAKDPKIGNRMINARSETAAEKPSFRTAFKRRRCLIPADGYYEWRKQGKKIPAYIQHAECELFAFAGLWESWKKPDESWLRSCAILTTEANEKLRPIHHRMAVIIEPEDYHMWLAPRELLPPEWQPLMAGPRPEQLKFHEVSTDVNSPANDNPSLVLPYKASSQRDLF